MGQAELPAPDAPKIHVHTKAGQLDPLSRQALSAKVAAGEVSTADNFWFAGMDGWKPIHSVPELLKGLDAAAAPAAAPANTDDDHLDAVFGKLVDASWEYFEDHNFAGHVDEVFLGAIITSSLDKGYSLIDITSDGTSHYLRFEDLSDHHRVIVRFTHLTANLATAKVLDHRASMVIGYGQKMKNFGAVWKALKAEYKSGLLGGTAPGTMSVDGDMASSYVYVQVPLYMRIDDYVGHDYAIDYPALGEHLGATVHALRKYLRGRFA